MNKKSTTKSNQYPFANEIKHVKYEFKKMVDAMSDEEFAIFMLHMIDWLEDVEQFEDEEFDDFDENIAPFEELPF